MAKQPTTANATPTAPVAPVTPVTPVAPRAPHRLDAVVGSAPGLFAKVLGDDFRVTSKKSHLRLLAARTLEGLDTGNLDALTDPEKTVVLAYLQARGYVPSEA